MESRIVLPIPVILKNWVKDFDLYDTIPTVLSSKVTLRVPLVPKPTVESTSSTVKPIPALPITLVFGWTVKAPYVLPSTLISLLLPASMLSL